MVKNITRKIHATAITSVLNSITAVLTIVTYVVEIPAALTRRAKQQPVLIAVPMEVCSVTTDSKVSLNIRWWEQIWCSKFPSL